LVYRPCFSISRIFFIPSCESFRNESISERVSRRVTEDVFSLAVGKGLDAGRDFIRAKNIIQLHHVKFFSQR
jgi:hypothetical protein